MKDETLLDTGSPPHLTGSEDGDPKSVLTLLGKKAAPEEREALLKIGTDLLDGLRF